MKNKNLKKKKLSAGKRRSSINQDTFFDGVEEDNSKRRRRMVEDDGDEDIESEEDDDDDDDEGFGGGGGTGVEGGEEDKEEEEETAAEKRKRLAEMHLQKYRALTEREEEEDREGSDDDGYERRREREGERDSLIASMLQQKQLEESGRVRKAIASTLQKPEATDGFRVLVKHRQSVTAVALSGDDLTGFSTSKDGTIVKWDVDSGKAEKYTWPSDEVLKSHGVKDPQGRATKHSKHVLALAVSSDNRYLATGGLDRHIHLWDVRTREHLQAFPGHKGPVSCLAFRLGTSELFSGSFDRAIKIWNAEDRAYINTLYGHQSDVLTIDCLRKERALTVGRDRTMHLWKVPEESQLVFRAPAAALECCCFIDNDEFLSGSDDGSIEHWNVKKKKPVHIFKNAHTPTGPNISGVRDNEGLSNGHLENGTIGSENQNPSVVSWVSSVGICRDSDLAASGAGNGFIRLWAIESESRGIRPLFELPVVGFVNSLAFASDGRFLVAGVGQEPRLGRWGRLPMARNGVAVHPLKLS